MSNNGWALRDRLSWLCGTIDNGKQAQSAATGDGRKRPAARARAPRRAASRPRSWLWALALSGPLAASPAPAQETPQAGTRTGVSGLPLPRFVSLKVDRVNLRAGPGLDYPAVWEYRRAGLPVEIIEEFEGWRRVRDSGGTAGWVIHSLLSGRRTALVLPWEIKPGASPPRVALQRSDSARAKEVASIEAGVIADVHSCDGRWCAVTIDLYRGYIEQAKLWGVYPNEVVK